MSKAIGLVSGGLDSILAVKMVLEQGIEVIGVCFVSPFFDKSEYISSICSKLSIECKVIKFGDEYIKIIKNPKYGYGKNMNPCIDCHAYMLKQAKNLMQEIKADFVFTGEVLNERPMSQNRQALKNVEREASLVGRLLRPLSAQLLEPTIPETSGIIDRNKLGKISGRSRKTQLELAKKYGITDFPQPAGGCLLTEPNFSKRLKDALEHGEDSPVDLELLKIGRHFRFYEKEITTENAEKNEIKDANKTVKIIVGRNEQENNQLLKLASSNDLTFEPTENAGPVVLIHDYKNNDKIIQIGAGLCARYSDKENNSLVKVKYNDIIIETEPLTDSQIDKFRI